MWISWAILSHLYQQLVPISHYSSQWPFWIEMTALIIFCLAKLRTSLTLIFISSTPRLTEERGSQPLPKCFTQEHIPYFRHEYNTWRCTKICDNLFFRWITTGGVKCTDVWHLLRYHENKSERNIECIVRKELMMQTKQRELLCEYFIINVWMVLAFCLDINSIWKLYTKSRLILILLYNFSSWYWKILYLYIYLYI